MLAAIYGLQALIFMFRMRWDMIAWMICECLDLWDQDRGFERASIDISLHSGHPGVLVFPPAVLVLENG